VGDLVNLIGIQDDLDEVTSAMGECCLEHLEQDLTKYDKRRFFVSNSKVAGKRLRDLDLLGNYGAIVTRIRRGDVELLPHGDTVLALGDQIRIVAEYDTLEQLASLLGDSYRAVSEIDILTFSLGLGIGLLVGLVPIPLPGGLHFSLGVAGGPLIIALLLGALGRTGPLVWSIPYSANLTLRQAGLILFLAGVGTRSGYAFYSTLRSGSGFAILASGAAITCIVALVALVIGYRLLKIPMTILMGILSGMQTQTAVLTYAIEQTGNEIPAIDYATIYPVATVAKIIIAQVLIVSLMRG
jgi:putative transport protein